MTQYDYAELGLCVGLYLHLGYMILKSAQKQSFAMWFLWGSLDAIVAGSIIFQHGNYTAVSIYACSGFIISACIWWKHGFQWGRFETIVSSLAIICMIVWAISGPRNATIAGTLAVVIATLPGIRDTYKNPWDSSLITWSGFLAVNVIATLQGKAWTVQERFYPLVCVGICAILLACTAQKLWLRKPVALPQEI